MSPRHMAWLLMWRTRVWAERNFLVLLWIAMWVTIIAYYVAKTSR